MIERQQICIITLFLLAKAKMERMSRNAPIHSVHKCEPIVLRSIEKKNGSSTSKYFPLHRPRQKTICCDFVCNYIDTDDRKGEKKK